MLILLCDVECFGGEVFLEVELIGDDSDSDDR